MLAKALKLPLSVIELNYNFISPYNVTPSAYIHPCILFKEASSCKRYCLLQKAKSNEVYCLFHVFCHIYMALNNPDFKSATSIHEFTVKKINGQEVKLEVYKDHVCIIVNVASQCSLATANYKQLNDLHEQYAESKGLRILAFPCNQFNNQEPGNSEEITYFAAKHNVKFDLFEKIDVNGDKAEPLWKYLKHKHGSKHGNLIKSNFTKFIVNKAGLPVERHELNVNPVDLVKCLENYWQ